MTAERWARIKEIFGEAFELPEGERAEFLNRACASDSELRRQVDELLLAGGGAFENPVFGALAPPVEKELKTGETLGNYRIESKLGQGAMGTVYRAHDARLDRPVALKVLRGDQWSYPARKERFRREALAASGLLHPNIVTVYDIGTDRDIDYIAMEYIEGRSLDQAIQDGGLPLKQALGYAVQIGSALARAHAAGIVHRDLKPRNIMINRDGLVKLLDFGLARSTRIGGTDSKSLTLAGEILGTPAYMSPEQVAGADVDCRSDLFSFGTVLFEMLTGRCAFDRGSAVETMSAVLRAEPIAWPEGENAIPSSLRNIVQRCLEKSPENRFQSARDLTWAIETGAGAGQIGSVSSPPPNFFRRYGRWVAAGAIGFLVACLFIPVWLAGSRAPMSAEGRVFAALTTDGGAELFPSLSPDGKMVVYASKASGNWDVMVRRLGSDESVNLTRESSDDDTQPVFSPDGREIAFRSDRGGGGVYVMDVEGKHPRRLAEAGFNPAWSPDGRYIYYAEEGIIRPEDRVSRLSHLWSVDVKTGAKRMIGKDDGVQPQSSPSGRYLAYWAIDLDGHRDIYTIPVEGGQPLKITSDTYLNWNPVWSPDGKYLYFCSNRSGNTSIWRVPMKESSGEARGSAEPIRTPATYNAHLSFSRDGKRLAFVQQLTTGRLRTVRFEPAREAAVSEPKEILQTTKGASRPALSPDGNWLAFNSTEHREDLFLIRADGSGFRQLTSDKARNRGPRWSPDGKRIAFFSTRSGDWEIWIIDADGSDMRQVTKLAGQNVAWPVWSPDGKQLAYTIFGVNTFVIDPLKAWDDQTPRRLPPMGEQGVFNGWSWSPDGRLIAGFLNRGDGIALYAPATQTYRKLTDIGADPVWLSDSRRLLFHYKGAIYMLDTNTGRQREVISISPEEIARRGFAISEDDRNIYFSLSTTEADVWMMTFEQ